MPRNRTNLGLSIGQMLSNTTMSGYGNMGRAQALQEQALRAQTDNQLADVALKNRQLSIDPEEMAANEVGAFGSFADQLKKFRQTGQSDIHEQPIAYNENGEVDLSRSGPANNISPELARQYGQAINAYTYAQPGKYNDTQKGIGQGQKNNMVQQIANGEGDAGRIAKALLAAAGKGAFNSFNGGAIDTTTGAQTINGIGESLINQHNASANQSNAGAQKNMAQANAAFAKISGPSGVNAPMDTNGQIYSTKPIPTPALKMQQEELDTIGTVAGTNADLSAIHDQIDKGNLKLGTLTNYTNSAKNFLGHSDESSRDYATLQATLEKARNASLLLNKGVQTDGDAKRAWNELISNINDPENVKKRLTEIMAINSRALAIRKSKVNTLRRNYNAEPMDFSEYEQVPTAVMSGSETPLPQSRGNVRVDITNPEALSNDDRKALQDDIEQSTGSFALHESDGLPNPEQWAGKRLTDSVTGKVFKSDGKKWVKQ